MEVSTRLKERFCKDNNLSIQVFEEPYFTERLELFGEKDNYDSFVELVNSKFAGNEELFFAEYNSLKDKIIDFIKNSDAFIHLNTCDMNQYAVNISSKQVDVYKEPYIGKRFLSIDIRKANFSSLVHYGLNTGNLFFDNYNWNDFMKQFTDISHFIDSKYIRQVVFGNCNPKRQVTYEKYLTCNVLNRILSIPNVDKSFVYSFCNDEIVLCVDNMDDNTIQAIWDLCEKELSSNYIPLKVEYFLLGKVTNTSAYMKRIYYSITRDKYEDVIKCASAMDSPIIYRKLKGEPFNPNDLVFLHDKRLATYMTCPIIDFVFET